VQEQASSSRPCRERFSEAEEQDSSIFLLDDGDNGTGMDETIEMAGIGRYQGRYGTQLLPFRCA
jgi:hypothetical protein